MSTSNKPPTTEQLDAQLAYLKLSFIKSTARTWPKRLHRRPGAMWSFLARLIAGEALLRQQRSV